MDASPRLRTPAEQLLVAAEYCQRRAAACATVVYEMRLVANDDEIVFADQEQADEFERRVEELLAK